MARNIVMLCLAVMLVGGCFANREVVDNTYPLMPGKAAVVSDDYEYVGKMRHYAGVYGWNKIIPSMHRPIDSFVFACDSAPRRFLLISRWRISGGWGMHEGGDLDIDGVNFKGWIWRCCKPGDDKVRFLAEKGYDFSAPDFYKYRLGKVVSRNEAYNIYVYVEKGELNSDEWSEVKPYVRNIVLSSLSMVDQ